MGCAWLRSPVPPLPLGCCEPGGLRLKRVLASPLNKLQSESFLLPKPRGPASPGGMEPSRPGQPLVVAGA